MTLQEAIAIAGYEPRSYSGRGMFGRECLAYEVAAQEMLYSLLAIGRYTSTDELPAEYSIRYDALGRTNQIVYFLDHTFEEDTEATDDADDEETDAA